MSSPLQYFYKPINRPAQSTRPSNFSALFQKNNVTSTPLSQVQSMINIPTQPINRTNRVKTQSDSNTPLRARQTLSKGEDLKNIQKAISILEELNCKKNNRRMETIESLITQLNSMYTQEQKPALPDPKKLIELRERIQYERQERIKTQIQTEQLIGRQKQTILLLQTKCSYFKTL